MFARFLTIPFQRCKLFLQVSHKAKVFLDSIVIEPIIDVKTFNAALFEFAPELVIFRGRSLMTSHKGEASF